MSTVLVTGGAGFIGSALVRSLAGSGAKVRVLDDGSRGAPRRLAGLVGTVELVNGDVRDPAVVDRACEGVDAVWHLAAVNGTEFFYSKPELVLDVGVGGMRNVIAAAITRGVRDLFVASSSEVYQTPPKIPTDETAPLTVPDPLNPRYSYGAGKLISEIMAINYGRKFFERVLIFRPHNVYGPDMGFEHVIPQFALRLYALAEQHPAGPLRFAIQGTGAETRSFCFIDDLVAGILVMREKGEHLGIYHVGTTEEVTIADLARRVARAAGREVELVAGEAAAGGTLRRCPDISKLAGLGYKPRVPLDEGLRPTLDWYWRNADLAPKI